MKIAIIGASGLVGSSLLEYLAFKSDDGFQVIGTYHTHPFNLGVHLDITSKDDIKEFIDSYQPDTLVWLSGSKDLKLLEKNPELSYLLNEKPIDDLLTILNTSSPKVRLIYISSDYVFDGNIGGYTSADRCLPDTVYGKSKVYVENKINESGIDSVCLRTSAVMNAKGGFLGWLLGQIKGDGEIQLYSNTIFSPTPSISFNKAIFHILSNPQWSGIHHFAGSAMSRYEFGRNVSEMLGVDLSLIKPMTADIAHSMFHKNLSLITSPELQDMIPGNEELKEELKRYMVSHQVADQGKI